MVANTPSRLTLLVLFAVSMPTSAAVQRTFVASGGADTNPCSITLPCRSFGTAIGKTVAGGEVIVQDSAGYGVVAITQSVSVIAPSGVYAGSPAVTKFAVESSVISNNGGDGVFAGGSSTGQIIGIVRRNVIAGNGLSGISAFNLVDGGQSSVQTADNSFSGNGFYAIKVQGYPSQVYSSANLFAWYENTFWTGSGGVGAGYQATYGDNTGSNSAFGPAPALFSRF